VGDCLFVTLGLRQLPRKLSQHWLLAKLLEIKTMTISHDERGAKITFYPYAHLGLC